jgi:O-antigen/teichoic acid export membrane protein
MSGSWARVLPTRVRERLESSPTLQRFLPVAAWLVGHRVVRLMVSLVVGVWVARYLGPRSYGDLSFALACVAVLSPLATLGFDRLVVRDLVELPDAAPETLGSAFALRMLGGLAAGTLALAAIALLRPGNAEARALVALAAAAQLLQAADVVEQWFQAQVRPRAAVVATLAAGLLGAALKVILILARAPLVAFAWALLAEAALAGVGLALAYRLAGGRPGPWRWSRERAVGLLRDGWPLMLSSAMVMVYLRIDQVMLGKMASSEEVGNYSIAVRLVEVWYFLPMAIVAAVFPGIIEARRVSEALFLSRLQKLYGLMALLGYAVALPTCLLASWALSIVFGDAYGRAGPMVAVLVWSLPFTNLGVARGSYLTAMNWKYAYLFMVALGGVVNVVLNLALIPRWGGMGAVIASCISYWLAAHGACYLYPPLRPTGNMLARALVRPLP